MRPLSKKAFRAGNPEPIETAAGAAAYIPTVIHPASCSAASGPNTFDIYSSTEGSPSCCCCCCCCCCWGCWGFFEGSQGFAPKRRPFRSCSLEEKERRSVVRNDKTDEGICSSPSLPAAKRGAPRGASSKLDSSCSCCSSSIVSGVSLKLFAPHSYTNSLHAERRLFKQPPGSAAASMIQNGCSAAAAAAAAAEPPYI